MADTPTGGNNIVQRANQAATPQQNNPPAQPNNDAQIFSSYDQNYSQGVTPVPDGGRNLLERANQFAPPDPNNPKPDPNAQKIPNEQWDYKTATTDKMGNPLPNGATGFDPYGRAYYGEGLQGWWNGVVSRITDPGAKQAKFDFASPNTSAGQVVGKIASNVEQAGNLSDTFGMDSPLTPILRTIKEGIGAGFTALSLPAQGFERVVGTASELLRSDRQARDVGEAWAASAITYSSFFDVSKRDQFLKSYREGQNPDFLAMQLENPTAEFWGQLILDPTWVLGMAAKGEKGAQMLETTAEKLTRTGALHSEQATRIVEELSGAGKALDDVGAASKLESIGKTVSDAVNATKTGMQSYKPGLFSRLTASQQAIGAEVSGRHVGWVMSTMQNLGKNPEEIMDTLYHTAMLASENEGERSVALSYVLAHHPVPKMALSDEGLQTAVTLWHSVGNDSEGFINGLMKAGDEGGLESAINFAQGKIGNATKDMYPSVTQMREAADAVAKGNQDQKLVHLADQYKTMGPGVQAAERLASSALPTQYRKIVGTLTGVYLASPGYVIRNIINNAFTGFVDQGAKFAFGRGGKAMTFERAAKDLSEMAGMTIKSAGFGKSGDLVDEAFSLSKVIPKWSDNVERGMGTMVMRASMQDSFEKLLKPGKFLPDIAPLMDAGVSPEQAQMFTRYILDANGDVDKALLRMRGTTKATGAVASWKDTTRLIGPEVKKFLDGMHIHGDVLDKVHADYNTADEAVQEIVGNIRSHIEETAKGTADEAIAVSEKHPAATIAADWTSAQGEGLIDAGKSEKFGAMLQAGQNMETHAKNAGELLAGLAPGGVDTMETIQKIQGEFRGAGSAVAQQTKALTDRAWEIKDLSKNGKMTLQGWSQFLERPVSAVEMADPQKLLGEVFNKRFEQVSGMWNDYYVGLKGRTDKLYGQLAGSMDEASKVKADAILNRNNELFDHYNQVSQAFHDGKNLVIDPLAGKSGKDYLIGKANQYGYSTTDATGKIDTSKNLLNTINTYSPEAVKKSQVIKDAVQQGIEATAVERRAGAGRRLIDFAPSDVKHTLQAPADKVPFDMLGGKSEEQWLKDTWHLLFDSGKSVKGSHSSKPRVWEEVLKDWKEKGISPLDQTQAKLGEDGLVHSAPTNVEVGRNAGRRSTDLNKTVSEAVGLEPKPAGYIKPEQAAQPLDAYKSLDEIPNDVADAALKNWAEATGHKIPEPVTKPVSVPYAGNAPTVARVAEQSQKALEPELQKMEQFIRSNWGETMGTFGDKTDAAFAKYAADSKPLIAQARKVGIDVAHNARDFSMLNYNDKRGFDAALNYILPMSFWPSRTYGTWMQRVITDPGILAAYAKYKSVNEKIHADMPEFYKYQVNPAELLGMHTDNPLFFNLEATLWPLNGLTGVDFNDPYKRVDWWTALLDDASKSGPSIATPITAATAVALYMRGEKDAAARWGGRLFPATAQIKSALALGNVQLPDTPFTHGNELDPFVNFFSNGSDPYERRRIGGAALQKMVDDGKITREQALDASDKQSGPVWEAAKQLEAQQRAGPSLASWGLGVGWKGRTATDLRIDKFYQEYNALSKQVGGGHLSPDATRQNFDALRQKYPFMDLVILSKKDGPDRDRAYAYNTLARIPPGQSTQLALAAGISDALIQKFYDDKGNMKDWPATDQEKFMAGVNDLSAVLAIPDSATKDSWSQARTAYSNLNVGLQQVYGEDILSKVDNYFQIGNETQKQRDLQANYLKLNPDVQRAMDSRTAAIAQIPELTAYHGGIDAIEKYYKMQMYTDLKSKLGQDIFDKFDEYGQKKLVSPADASAFYRANPQLKKYSALRAQWQDYINHQIAQVGTMLKPGLPAQIRPDTQQSTGTQAVQSALAPTPQRSWADWSKLMPETLQRIVLDYIQNDHKIPASANNYLDRLAGDYGYSDSDALLQSIGTSYYQQVQP